MRLSDPQPPARSWQSPAPVTRTLVPRPRSPWATVGAVITIILVVAGLAYLAAMILVIVAASQTSTNK